MAVLLASLAPVFIILFYIYFRDKYEKEPLGMLVQSLVGRYADCYSGDFCGAMALCTYAPFREGRQLLHSMPFWWLDPPKRLFKFLALYLLIWKSPSFNEKFDGIVYAVFVSLGFAAVENVMYVMDGGFQTATVRALTAVPAHAIFGVTMGYYLGIAHMYTELGKQISQKGHTHSHSTAWHL